ncbi:MAG: cytochrome P450 [Byssovorax sp.]
MIAADANMGRDSLESPAHFDVPLISVADDLRSFAGILTNYAETSLTMHVRHGFAFRQRLPTPTLCVAHPRHHHRMMRTNVLNYLKSVDYDFLRPILGNGIFVSEGDFWARQRRLLSPEFRPSAVNRFLPVLIEAVEGILDAWAKSGRGAERDVSDDMMRLTVWGVGGALFHSDFRAEAERIGHALEICLAQGTLMMMSMGLLKPWMPTPGNRRARRAERDLNTIVRGLIERHRQGGGEGDMLSRLLHMKDEETGGSMTGDQLLDEIKSLILAGHETTSLTLSWAFYLLSQHPDIEARLVDEVGSVLGGRAPAVDDLPKLDLTRRVFQETMRLYPPVPTVLRAAKEADSFDGIDVRAGERIALNVYATHRHPDLWERPDAFDPDRFAPPRADKIAPYSYLPFLLGRRACLGEHFAMLEGVVALAMLIDRYRLERVDPRPIGTRPISTLRLERPLVMRVHPRRPAS